MPDDEIEDRRSSPRAASKDPQLIKTSLRGLQAKAQLFPADISTIQQALMDISDNLTEMRKRLEALEATASDAGSARHAAGTASTAL
jgi:chromosome segregation ATPase